MSGESAISGHPNFYCRLLLLSLPATPGILQPGSFCTERDAEGAPGKGGRSEQRAAGFWSQACSANAVILICINLFFYAYFA